MFPVAIRKSNDEAAATGIHLMGTKHLSGSWYSLSLLLPSFSGSTSLALRFLSLRKLQVADRQTHTHTLYIHSCICIRLCVHICIYIYIHIYVHTHSSTHTHIYIYMLPPPPAGLSPFGWGEQGWTEWSVWRAAVLEHGHACFRTRGVLPHAALR